MLPRTFILLTSSITAAAAATVKRAGCSGFAGTCGRAYAHNGTSGRPDADMTVYTTYCFDQAGERNYNPMVLINDCLSNTFGQLTGGTGYVFLSLCVSCLWGISIIISAPLAFALLTTKKRKRNKKNLLLSCTWFPLSCES